MTKLSTTSRVPKRDLKAFLRQLPQFFSGRKIDAKGSQYTRIFLAAFTQNLFQSIHAAYLVKSRGQSDELGNQWKPLAPSTIRRKLASQARRGPITYDFLTTKQTGLWKRLRSTYSRQLVAKGMGLRDADHKARRMAWKRLRDTPTGQSSTVPIGIETTALITSLQPGSRVGGRYYPAPKQIYRPTRSGVRIGSEVKHAPHFHKRRRIWPAARRMRPWLNRAARAGLSAITTQLSKDVS